MADANNEMVGRYGHQILSGETLTTTGTGFSGFQVNGTGSTAEITTTGGMGGDLAGTVFTKGEGAAFRCSTITAASLTGIVICYQSRDWRPA